MTRKKMMNLDGFSINIFQDEEGDWVAHFSEMPHISAFSDTPDKALLELAEAWEGVKESYQKHKKPIPSAPTQKQYSGRFNVRIDKRIHKSLVIEAVQAGISLNALVSQKLATSIQESYEFEPPEQRINRGMLQVKRVASSKMKAKKAKDLLKK
jgi:predicted HicB family RNase H-like nuclease